MESYMSGLSFQDTAISFRHLSTGELKKAWYLFKLMSFGKLVYVGGWIFEHALKAKLPVAFLVRNNLFAHFCGGETLDNCVPKLDALTQKGICTALHFAIEGAKKSEDFEVNTQRTIDTMRFNRKKAVGQKHHYCVLKITGIVKASLLEKIQNNEELSTIEKAEYQEFNERLNRICTAAQDFDSSILIDAEESWIQGEIDLVMFKLMAKYNKDRAVVYTTIQMYRKDRLKFLHECADIAKEQDYYLGIKLVRGAYLEKERARAKALGIESPICHTKLETDRQFHEGLEFCLKNRSLIAVFAGTHNEFSTSLFCDFWTKSVTQDHDQDAIISQLLGMSDNLTYNLAHHHIPVCKYIPYAPVEKLIPFLIRRANENTSITGDISRELELIEVELKRRKRL